MLGNGYGNGYSTTSSTFYFILPAYSNTSWPPSPLSKKGRKLQELLAKFNGDAKKLGFKLAAAEIERKAKSDAVSRGRKPHPSSRAPTDRRLQTYDAALAARMASKRP